MSLRIGIGLGIIPTAARPAATTAPVNVVKPFFEGPLTQGQSAAVNPGSWTGLPSPNFVYAIKRGATTVSTDPAYVWTSADVAAGANAMTPQVAASNDIGPTTATGDPVTIAPPLQLSGVPAAAAVGAPYAFTPSRSGGHAPFAFTYTGTLPAGMTFNPATGAITGTAVASGSATLIIGVTDNDGLTATLGPFSLEVTSGAPSIGDPIAFKILDATKVSKISPNGWVAAITFKGMALGQALDASKISLEVEGPGYSATGATTTLRRTITGTSALRKPIPQTWISGLAVSLGDRCSYKSSGSTKIYQAAGSGTTGATPPTHSSSSASDGAVTWAYVGNSTDASPPQQKLEAVDGADAIVYVVLDQYIYDGEVITGVNVGAGAYGASRASSNIATPSNASTRQHLRPDVAWLTEPYQLVTGALHAELAVVHPYGGAGRMAACVKFVVRDGSGGVATSTVTSMQASTVATAGHPIPVFAANIDVSSLADGQLTVEAEVYPFFGSAAYLTVTHGFGPSTLTTASTLTANVAKKLQLRKDAAGTFGRLYAYVDPASGNDATGVCSTTASTAAASPFQTIQGAAGRASTGLQAQSNTQFGRNNLANHVIRLKAGTYANGFGAAMTALTMGDVWLTIERDPAAGSVSDVNITPAATAAFRQGAKRVKYSGITFTATSSAPVIDNVASAAVGNFGFESWFVGCDIIGIIASGQKPFARAGLMWAINCNLTHVSTLGAENTATALPLVAGCHVSGASSLLPALNGLGNFWTGGASAGTVNFSRWGENTGVATAPDIGIWLANSWYQCTANVGFPNQVFTTGVSWVQNLIEVYTGTSVKGGTHSGDGNVTPIGHIYYLYNSAPGEGPNLVYNDVGTGPSAYVEKLAIVKFNASNDRNFKADFYDATPNADENRVGNFSTRYGVDANGNAVFSASKPPPPTPNNLAGEVIEARSTWSGAAGWTSDASKTGTGVGNGDYRPTTSSAAKGRVLATEQMLPFDQAGTVRKTDGTGAAGALEWA